MPRLGNLAVDAISTDDVMAVLIPIWTAKTETAARVRLTLPVDQNSEFVRYEIVTRSAAAGGVLAGHLDHLLAAKAKVRPVQHHKALPIDKVPPRCMRGEEHHPGISGGVVRR